MAQFGQFSLVLAFVLAIYSIGASLLGIRLKNDRLIASGRNAGVGVFASLSAAISTLAYLFLASDFSIQYVASYSNRDLPFFYKIAAVWGGQEGSLLLWGWILSLYAALVLIQNRRRHTAMMPYVAAVLMATSVFFTSLNLFVTNPFNELVLVQGDGTLLAFAAADGRGLNPLLQYVLMVIHPPMLYTGFVGFSIPSPSRWRRWQADRWETPGFGPPGAGRWWPGSSSGRASCWAASGPTWSWDGAATGPGTRSRTLR